MLRIGGAQARATRVTTESPAWSAEEDVSAPAGVPTWPFKLAGGILLLGAGLGVLSTALMVMRGGGSAVFAGLFNLAIVALAVRVGIGLLEPSKVAFAGLCVLALPASLVAFLFAQAGAAGLPVLIGWALCYALPIAYGIGNWSRIRWA